MSKLMTSRLQTELIYHYDVTYIIWDTGVLVMYMSCGKPWTLQAFAIYLKVFMSQRMDNIDDTIGCFGQKWNKFRDKTIK